MRVPALFLALAAAPLVAGCSAGSSSPTLIVAHRGASHAAPENTMAAFDLAWQEGADAIEGDFHLTGDGAIVAHHDRTTERTAGVDRPIAEQSFTDLRRHDVGSWKHAQFAGERIPELAEVLRSVPPDRRMLIEVKSDARIVPSLIRVLDASPLHNDRMTVICFDEEVIARLEAERPETRTCWLSSFEEDGNGGWTPDVEHVIEVACGIGADGVDLNANPAVLDEAFVGRLRTAGLEFHVWTVNDAALARRMVELGVDSITTDRPGWLRDALESTGVGASSQ